MLRRFQSFMRALPIQTNWVLIILILFAVYNYIIWEPLSDATLREQKFASILLLLVKLLAGFLLIMLVLATITTLIAYLYVRYRKHNVTNPLIAIYKNEDDGKEQLLFSIPRIAKPLLGKLDAIIYYENAHTNPSVIKDIQLGRHAFIIPMADIQHYKIRAVRFVFRDFLNLYQLYTTAALSLSVAKQPSGNEGIESLMITTTANDDQIHTDISIHAPGEWLQYKPFEFGDDVRRVLWKLYAKNKELVVRHQETYSHYTSEVSIIVHAGINQSVMQNLGPEVSRYLLNFYKNIIYQMVSDLVKNQQQFELTILQTGLSTSNLSGLSTILTEMEWKVSTFTEQDMPSGALFLTHSLLTNEEIALLGNYNAQVRKVVIPLYQYLPLHISGSLWRKLWFIENYHEDDIRKYLPKNETILAWQDAEQSLMALLPDS